MEANYPSASIKFANIRIGEIGSTFPGGSCWLTQFAMLGMIMIMVMMMVKIMMRTLMNIRIIDHSKVVGTIFLLTKNLMIAKIIIIIVMTIIIITR